MRVREPRKSFSKWNEWRRESARGKGGRRPLQTAPRGNCQKINNNNINNDGVQFIGGGEGGMRAGDEPQTADMVTKNGVETRRVRTK